MNDFLERLTSEQKEELENGLSKTFFDNKKVEIKLSWTGLHSLFVDGEKHSYVSDFVGCTTYDENIYVAFCSYMLHVFGEEYMKAFDEYIAERSQRNAETIEKMQNEGKDATLILKDEEFHSKVHIAVAKEYMAMTRQGDFSSKSASKVYEKSNEEYYDDDDDDEVKDEPEEEKNEQEEKEDEEEINEIIETEEKEDDEQNEDDEVAEEIEIAGTEENLKNNQEENIEEEKQNEQNETIEEENEDENDEDEYNENEDEEEAFVFSV